VTAAVLGLTPDHHPTLLILALLGTVSAVLLLTDRGTRRGAARTLAGVLLAAAAATTTTVLHTADLHRGPIPALAAPEAAATDPPTDAPSTELTVDLTIAGDPRARTARTHGTTPGQSLLTVPALVERVRSSADPPPDSPTSPSRPGSSPLPLPPPTPTATSTETRTPATVMVRAQDVPAWRSLIPSTRVTADVRVTPGSATASSAALLTVHGPPRALAPPDLPQRIAARLRAGLRSACDHLPPDTRGLLPGLVVGDTSRLPDELSEAFRATDLGHLTAVSGANLAVVLAVLLGAPARAGTVERGGLARLLGLSLRTTALLGTAVTLAFVTVCRPDPSVLRAAATGLIGLLALATGRPRQGLPALSGAALVLVLVDPYLARSFGFVLSALATAGLLVLGPRWTAALTARRWPPHLAAAVAATAAAQAFCAPVTILLAPRVSLVAVPCNLLAEAAVAPATLLGFAALVADPFSHPLARTLADLAAVPAAWLVAVARHGAALPGAQLAWPAGATGAALLVLLTVALRWAAPAFLASSRLRSRRTRLLLAACLALLLPAVLLRPPTLTRLATGWPPPGWRLAVCDIGQGDMTVLPVTADSAVVVDAGPDPKAADGCLRELGITQVPLVVLTHFHADHAEGLPGVLHGRTVGALQVTTLDSPPGEQARVVRWAGAAAIPVLRARRGEHRTAGPTLSWDVLWPADTPPADAPGPNNASIALLVTVGAPPHSLRVALLGDLEPPAQAALLQPGLGSQGEEPGAQGEQPGGHGEQPKGYGEQPGDHGEIPSDARAGPPSARRLGPVDVLKVAHHGSANQDWALMAALHPRLALISCGADNPYGHPSPHTVSSLRALGATVLRTDQVGDIAVLGDSGTLAAAAHPHPPRG